MSKKLFVLSLFHAIFSSVTFVAMFVLFIVFETEVEQFWKRYRPYPDDARSVFNAVTFVGGWAVMSGIAIWDYCALGSVLAIREHRSYVTPLPRPYSIFWCTTGEPNERLTDVCHGLCDGRIGRGLIIAARIGVISAMETISSMTIAAILDDENPRSEADERVYVLAIAITALVFIELILSIFGAIFHNMLTYHWVRRYHRVEILATEFSGEDSTGSIRAASCGDTGSHGDSDLDLRSQ